MNRFSATNNSEADVAAERKAIWDALTDPEVLPRLTPLLRMIEADGDRWRWELNRIGVLGASITPSFTEAMVFTAPERIEFTHAPPPGKHEMTSAQGWYELNETDDGTHLRISLTLAVELPLARAAGPAVRRVMESVMTRMGDRFAVNLARHLGVPG